MSADISRLVTRLQLALIDLPVFHQDAVEQAIKALREMDALTKFDAAIAAELPRVSAIEYNSHDICEHFASKVRERIAAIDAAGGETTTRNHQENAK